MIGHVHRPRDRDPDLDHVRQSPRPSKARPHPRSSPAATVHALAGARSVADAVGGRGRGLEARTSVTARQGAETPLPRQNSYREGPSLGTGTGSGTCRIARVTTT